MRNIHLRWIVEDMRQREQQASRVPDLKNSFMYYPYREISRALKKYLGRDDDYVVFYTIQNPETLMVLHEETWVRVHYDQVKKFL